MAACRSCGAEIVWVKLATGKNAPCDPAVLTIHTEDGRTVRGRRSHFASCPNADQHRNERR